MVLTLRVLTNVVQAPKASNQWHILSPSEAGSERPNRDPLGQMLDHDLEWLTATAHPGHGAVWQFVSRDRYLPLYAHDGGLRFLFAGFALGRMPIRRYVMSGNLPQLAESEAEEMLTLLQPHLGTRGVLFLIGVVEGEPLEQALQAPAVRRQYRVLQSGDHEIRRLARFPDGYEAYLATLPRKRRQDLRRSERRFERRFPDWSLQAYTEPEALDRLLNQIEPVSLRTYQNRLHGLGITQTGWIARKVQAGAPLGKARCYALFAGDQLLAWRIGFIHRGVYYSHHIGYDPSLAQWHPGIVLQLKVINDLCRFTPGVNELDMLHGDNPAKEKLSNACRREGKYYLFPRNHHGNTRFWALRGFNAFSDGVSGLTERFRIKERLRRRLRRAV